MLAEKGSYSRNVPNPLSFCSMQVGRELCISLRTAQWADQHVNLEIYMFTLPPQLSQADALCNVGAAAKLGDNSAGTTGT